MLKLKYLLSEGQNQDIAKKKLKMADLIFENDRLEPGKIIVGITTDEGKVYASDEIKDHIELYAKYNFLERINVNWENWRYNKKIKILFFWHEQSDHIKNITINYLKNNGFNINSIRTLDWSEDYENRLNKYLSHSGHVFKKPTQPIAQKSKPKTFDPKSPSIAEQTFLQEKFELPDDLQKQLENTTRSAIGYIYLSYIIKNRTRLFSNKKLNDTSYNQIKKVLNDIKKLTIGEKGNVKLSFPNILIPDFYSIHSKCLEKAAVNVEKAGDDIYIRTTNKKYPINMVISKDYAGWDLKQLNDYWNEVDNSYKSFEQEFDEELINLNNIIKTLSDWKRLDNPKINSKQELKLIYKKTIPNSEYNNEYNQSFKYNHCFRVISSRKKETSKSPNHFSNFMYEFDSPAIIQTFYLENLSSRDMWIFMDYIVADHIKTAKHEGRHLLQHYGNLKKGLETDLYGQQKTKLKHKFNVDIRGTNPHGISTPTSKHKDPEDEYGRVLHPFRDVEFKTNLYDYKKEIEHVLNLCLPKKHWKTGFKDIINYCVGNMDHMTFNRNYFANAFDYSTTKENLKKLYIHDRPKFNQTVKELYKLIFNT